MNSPITGLRAATSRVAAATETLAIARQYSHSVGQVSRLPDAVDPDAALREAGLSPSPWSAGPGAVFSAHAHDATKRIYVVSGSIDFDGLPLAAGQGLMIPAGTRHSALVGPGGVSCVEAFEGG